MSIHHMTPQPDLNALAQRIYKQNHQWWHDLHTGDRLERNPDELLMLVVSELAEALEGERKNINDDHLPHRKMAEVEMADAVIRMLDFMKGFNLMIFDPEDYAPASYSGSYADLVPDNKGEALLKIVGFVIIASDQESDKMLSCAIGQCIFYCEKHGYDLWGAVEEKLEYNRTRADHQREARLAENGKKF